MVSNEVSNGDLDFDSCTDGIRRDIQQAVLITEFSVDGCIAASNFHHDVN
jgi:hypothetical protein